MDVVDDILRHLCIHSRVSYRLEEGGHWGHRFLGDDCFQLHCVLEGECRYLTDGFSKWLTVQTGDVLVLPRGGSISVRDPHGGEPPLAEHDLREGFVDNVRGLVPPKVIVLGGLLEFAGQSRHPLISGLPDATLVRHVDLLRTGTKKHAGHMIDKALSDYRDTSSAILDRLFEILLIQVINAHAASAGPAYRFMTGLRDRAVSRAIIAIHENPGHNWSLERLADEAGLSRSTFSRQFTELTGIPAMQYLTLWRMHVALTRLKAGDRDQQRVAREVGYLSPAAFQKAFKRVHGFTPAKAQAA